MTRNETDRPTLPADITAIIFDLVATGLEGPHERMARQTLMNCSLCSKTCLWQCRKHIFAKIHFIVEESSCQTKAQTLLSVLQNPSNERILSAIRSFRLTIVSASGLLSAKHTRRSKWSNMRSSMIRVGRRFSGGTEPVDFVFQLLDLLSCLPLDSFAVDVGPQLLQWLDVKESVKNIFFNFRSNEHLKSLEFTGVLDLDDRLVAGSKPNNVKELKLRDVSLSGVYTTAMSNLANLQVLQVFADLERMRILPWSAELGFRVFSTTFSQIRTLVLSYPLQPYEQTTFWNAVASLSGSLENLEIRNIPGAYNGILRSRHCHPP
ncbi:hypothetical protein CPC08DRAFT_328706 [Agrocybe pediades]|nr:hypothetical protein CPC08DRAFT_328706 [Agrocybe pediades]